MRRILPAPGRFVIGIDAIDELGRHVRHLGTRAFIIGGKTSLSKVETKIRKTLGESDVEIVGIERGLTGCTHGNIGRLTEAGRTLKPDVCVGVGGGVASDTSKAVAFKLGLPIAVVGTTGTTNAESSACSVVYTEKHEFLEDLILPRNPDLVVIDTKIIVETGKNTLEKGMGDALAAKFEAEACHTSQSLNIHGGLGTSASLAAARLCFEKLMAYGEEAKLGVDNGFLTSAVEEAIEAVKLLSGLAWEGSGTAAAHAMHDGLTLIESIAPPNRMHGEIVAFCTLAQLILEHRPKEDFRVIIDWCHRVQLPITLEMLGSTDDKQLWKAAEKACDPKDTMGNMPFKVTPRMVHDAWLMTDLLGKRFLEGKL
jgi:glycerol dehydrogenase